MFSIPTSVQNKPYAAAPKRPLRNKSNRSTGFALLAATVLGPAKQFRHCPGYSIRVSHGTLLLVLVRPTATAPAIARRANSGAPSPVRQGGIHMETGGTAPR